MGEASGPVDVHLKIVGRGQVRPEPPPSPLSDPAPESPGLPVPELAPELLTDPEPELSPELEVAPEPLEEPEATAPLEEAETDPELEPIAGDPEPESASGVVDSPPLEEAHAATSIVQALTRRRRGREGRTISAVASRSGFRHATLSNSTLGFRDGLRRLPPLH
jgi:hypothetical protein